MDAYFLSLSLSLKTLFVAARSEGRQKTGMLSTFLEILSQCVGIFTGMSCFSFAQFLVFCQTFTLALRNIHFLSRMA